MYVPSTSLLVIVAGEIGFTPDTQLQDTFASADEGQSWKLMSAQPGFTPRSGHGVVVYDNNIYCVGGNNDAHSRDVSNVMRTHHIHSCVCDIGVRVRQVGRSITTLTCPMTPACRSCRFLTPHGTAVMRAVVDSTSGPSCITISSSRSAAATRIQRLASCSARRGQQISSTKRNRCKLNKC